jgi:ribulose-5-phosphate 4-epimerase/fuculose-1-phosphate aldolase
MGIKVGILTDYETEYQVDKLAHMDLLKYIHVIITSEEVGREKPSMQMFHAICSRMNANPWEIIMIGDNFKKDIDVDNQMYSYWFQPSNIASLDQRKHYTIFHSFVSLHEYFIGCKRDLEEFSQLSVYCGERFDLVQAGGGNTSVKIGDWMCIKASGYSMASITPSDGYVTINTGELLDDLYNNQIKDGVHYNTFRTKTRGSIETFMHAFLKKYTVHIHPIQVNRILISKESRDRVTSMFPDALVIDYFTPGIHVCEEIRKVYQGENVIFLLNHGMIVTHDEIDSIYDILETVVSKFEFTQEERDRFLPYKYTNVMSREISKVFRVSAISYFSEDRILCDYLNSKPYVFSEPCTFPDALIYCGIGVLRTTKDELSRDLQKIRERGEDYPKIVILEDTHIYCVGNSLKKCREIEDVFKSNLLILDTPYTKSYLSENEIDYLNNWDAEKYRKMI